MSDAYGELTAFHYASYRPPLHGRILDRVLGPGERFARGLDVGCGTGRSALALAARCERVWAVDASLPMLRRRARDPRVGYVAGTADALPLRDGCVGAVTLAGVLPYLFRDAVAAEVRRVCRPGAAVVTYDFEVGLDEVLRAVGLTAPASRGPYDHAANLSGVPGFAEGTVGRDRVSLQLTASELAHVLLSDRERLEALVGRYGVPHPFEALARDLAGRAAARAIPADLYFSRCETTA